MGDRQTKVERLQYAQRWVLPMIKIPKKKGGKRMKKIMSFLKDEEGVTAIEYGLIAALIAVVLIAALGATGDSLTALFERISAALAGA